jgi:hypothetical protein
LPSSIVVLDICIDKNPPTKVFNHSRRAKSRENY